MSGLSDFVLQLAGIPAPLIAQIDAASPQLQKLIELEQKLEPIFSTPQTLAQHISAAAPIIQAAVPDLVAVLPLVQGLAQLAGSKP
jgi:hypothetical protein